MKIAIIIGDITNSAGTERAVTNLANSMCTFHSYDVTIISTGNNFKDPAYALHTDVKLVFLNYRAFSKYGLFSRFFVYVKLILSVRKIIKSENYNFVLGTTHAFNMLLPIITAKAKTRSVGCEHMSYDATPAISKSLRTLMYRFLDSVVVLTNADKMRFDKHHKNVWVIPNSISFLPKKPANLTSKTMLAVGRLTRQKGFDILLDICKPVFEKYPDWKLNIFGDGEDKEDLVNKALRLGINKNVNFLASTSKIQEEFLASSIYLLSSRWEGLPMVLLETMATGLPPVSFDCPNGPADVITDGIDGYIVPMNNHELFVKKVGLLIENKKLRNEMGLNAREKVQKYTQVNIASKWAYFFENSLK